MNMEKYGKYKICDENVIVLLFCNMNMEKYEKHKKIHDENFVVKNVYNYSLK